MSKFAANPVYVMHEDLLVRLHALIAAGQCDSDAADAIRDEMDHTYRALSSEERERLEGLSADLYMLADDEVYAKPETSDEVVRKSRFERAYQLNDWPLLLKLIRQGVPWVGPHVMAFMRGNTYDQLGHYRIAELFYKKAYQLSGDHPLHAINLLNLYDRLGQTDELIDLANRVLDGADSLTDAVIYAAWMIHKNHDSEIEMSGVLARIEGLLYESESSNASNPLWFGTISACYLDVRNYTRSLEYWNRFMSSSEHPIGWMEHMARGQLNLLTGADAHAFTDFEIAVKLNAQHSLPYYCLAEHSFHADEYTKALALLDKAMSVPGTDALYAACWEMKAMIQATLGLKPAVVRRSFTKALEFCPESESIQQNSTLYDKSLNAGLGARQWIHMGHTLFDVNIDLTDRIRTLGSQHFNSFAA